VSVRNRAKITAPATIMKTMQEMRRVSVIESTNFFHVKLAARQADRVPQKTADGGGFRGGSRPP